MRFFYCGSKKTVPGGINGRMWTEAGDYPNISVEFY